MKAPKILTSIYLFLHPLSEQIETTIEERESSGWLLVFFLWASLSNLLVLIIFLGGINESIGSILRLTTATLAILALVSLFLARKWIVVLVRLFKKEGRM